MEDLDRRDCDSVLYQQGWGMLAMTDGSSPYVLPMSFGYDGEACYVQMTTSGRKNDILSENPQASLAVMAFDPESGASQSVLVEGSIAVVPEADAADGLTALAENAEFGRDLSVWGEPVQDVDLEVYRLDVETVTGHRFAPTEDG